MGLRINTNSAAMAATRALSRSGQAQNTVFERLASGNRVTKAADDAAGLSISENLRGQIRSLTQAERNANDGISFAQVAEGGLTEIGNIAIRLRELSVQAASDTVGDKERRYINQEVQSLLSEVDRISNVTSFNGTQLLNGDSSGKSELEFQIGIRNKEEDRIKFNVSEYDSRTAALGIEGLNFESIDGAREAMDRLDDAMGRIFETRAKLGASQNKMQATINNLQVSKENLSAARSRIADADIATETSELVRGSILQQAGVAVLAQANMAPQLALKLL